MLLSGWLDGQFWKSTGLLVPRCEPLSAFRLGEGGFAKQFVGCLGPCEPLAGKTSI